MGLWSYLHVNTSFANLITMDLLCVFKSASIMPPALSLLCKIALAILGLFWVHLSSGSVFVSFLALWKMSSGLTHLVLCP